MKLASLVLSSIVATTALAAVACGGSVEQPQSSASAASKAPVGANAHGAVKVIGQALGEVPLRPDQRTELEKLATDAEARHQPMLEGRKDLALAFADQVEKGAIDRAALQAKIDKVVADLEKSRADDRAALVRLHDILDKNQRGDFVDALEDRIKGKRHGDLAGEGEGVEGQRPAFRFGHMRQLAEDLKLTDEQKDKIKDVMKDAWRENMRDAKHDRGAKHGGPGEWRRHHKEGKHALEAFHEDKLDLDKVAPPQDLKAMAQDGVERFAKVADKILPLLTPEQRKIAAEKLRTMAANGNTLFGP